MTVFLRLLAAGVLILLAGCVSDAGNDDVGATSPPKPTVTAAVALPPNGEKATSNGLSIQVVGTCDSVTDKGKGMRLMGSGFTPDASYHITAWYPNNAAYGFIADGVAGEHGTTPGWHWDCYYTQSGERDEPGQYRLRMIDGDGQRKVETTFTVAYAE